MVERSDKRGWEQRHMLLLLLTLTPPETTEQRIKHFVEPETS